jgi:anti-sigma B factor antagonist
MNATTIDVESVGTSAVLHIHGEVTSASEASFMAAYGAATEAGARALILDFADLEYMNSGGIGLLVTLLIRAQRTGQRLLAVGLSEHYRQILALTRLDEAIAIHDTAAAALAATA